MGKNNQFELDEYENIDDEGKITCPECKGLGSNSLAGNSSMWSPVCPRCYGSGKLDWVEYIMGKKNSTPNFAAFDYHHAGDYGISISCPLNPLSKNHFITGT